MAIWDVFKSLFRKAQTISMVAPIFNWDIMESVPTEQMVQETYFENPIVHAAVNFKAYSASKVNLKLFRDGKLLEDHPAVRILQRPNPWMNQSDLWKQVIIDLALFGKSVWQKLRSNAGVTVGLWRLRPDWVTARVEGSEIVWDYNNPAGKQTFPSQDLVVLRQYDPLNQLGAFSPLKVVYPLAKMDNSLTQFQIQYLKSGGVPPLVLKVKGIMQPEQAEKLRHRWAQNYGGLNNWRMPAILDADADVERIGFDLDELDFQSLQDKIESRICAVFGVSPILLNLPGGLERSTYSNYEQALQSFWTNVLIPQLEDIKDVLDNQLFAEFGVESEWDFSQILVLQDDPRASLGILLQACLNGVVSVNEFRKYFDLEELPEDRFLEPGLKNVQPEESKAKGKAEYWEPMTVDDFVRYSQDLLVEPLQTFWEKELAKMQKEVQSWLRNNANG